MPKSKLEVLRDDLTQMFHQVRTDRRMCPQAHEAANVAGKIINSLKLEVDYAAARKEQPSIEYMEKK